MKLKKILRTGLTGLIISVFSTVLISAHAGEENPSFSFESTVGTDPASCGQTAEISVAAETSVTYCHTVTNHGNVSFNTHTLESDVYGTLLSDVAVNLEPGDSYEVLDTRTVSSEVTQNTSWTAAGEFEFFNMLTSDDAEGPVYDFVDISGTGTALGLQANGERNVTMDFVFNFNDVESQEVVIGNNGALRYDSTDSNITSTNSEMVNTSSLIAPFWDNLSNQTGNVYHETKGTEPNRVFIVQWEDRPHDPGNVVQTPAAFQVKMFEGTNVIEFHYENTFFNNADNLDWDYGGSATIGVGGGSTATEFSYNTASLTNNFAIGFTPKPRQITETSMTTVTIAAGNPLISFESTVGTDPANCASSSDITVDPGTSVTYCHTVINEGNLTLNTHTLESDVYGTLLSDVAITLNPGQSYEVLDTRTPSSTVTQNTTWTALGNFEFFTIQTSDDVNGPTYDFTDISTTGTALGLGNNSEGNATIDFEFTFTDITSQDVRVSNDGVMRFGVSSGDIPQGNSELVNDSAGNLIAPFWDNIGTGSGDVYYETTGTAPDRVFIVQWDDRPHNNGSLQNATFQVKMFEGTNAIEFHYENTFFENSSNPDWDYGGSATIGVGGGITASQFSFNTASLVNNFAISFIPTGFADSTIQQSMTTVTVNEADIEVPLADIGLAFSMNVDELESQDLEIKNVGTFVLNWDLENGIQGRSRTFERIEGLPSVKSPDLNASIGSAPIVNDQNHTNEGTNEGNQPITLGSNGTLANSINVYETPDVLTSINLENLETTEITSDLAWEDVFAGDYFAYDFSILYGIRTAQLELISIDPSTGNTIVIGSMSAPPSGENYVGMSWDPDSNDMYILSSANNSSSLFTVNLQDASTNLVGTTSHSNFLVDIAFDINGNLYGAGIGTDELVGIDKSNGTVTSIGPLGININFAQDLDFDYTDNTLYLASCISGANCGRLYTLNLATGEATEVGLIGNQVSEHTAFAIQGIAFCDEPVSWISLPESIGSTNYGGTSVVSVDVDTTGLALGVYDADICINSNDPDEPITIVPVLVNVNDIIFSDGFE